MLVATETSLWIVAKSGLLCVLVGFSLICTFNAFFAIVEYATVTDADSPAIRKLLQLPTYVLAVLNIEYGLLIPIYFTDYYIHDGF